MNAKLMRLLVLPAALAAGAYWTLVDVREPVAIDTSASIVSSPSLPETQESWPPRSIDIGEEGPKVIAMDELLKAPWIAEVMVEDIHEVRFNTPDGAMPTQSMADADLGLMLFSPMTLRVVRWIRGHEPRATAVVVAEHGGVTDSFTNYQEPMQAFSGSALPLHGYAFIRPLDYFEAPLPQGQWILSLQNLADALELSEGQPVAAGDLIDFYATLGDGIVTSYFGMHSQELTHFLSDVYSAVGWPTPTMEP